VQFIAPEEDAGVILTLDRGTPGDAAAAFVAQEGVRSGQIQAIRVNGLDAASVPVRLDVEGGTLEGEALFIALEGMTYRLLAVASASNWPARHQTARAIQGSFRRETNSRILAVEPARLEVVRLDASLDFATFVARHPSSVETDRVALINQVNPGDRLEAGLWKQIVGGR
jgi:predicted Zn-dependent protease